MNRNTSPDKLVREQSERSAGIADTDTGTCILTSAQRFMSNRLYAEFEPTPDAVIPEHIQRNHSLYSKVPDGHFLQPSERVQQVPLSQLLATEASEFPSSGASLIFESQK